MRTLTVNVARVDCVCQLWIGHKLIQRLPELLNRAAYTKVAIVADRGAEVWARRVAEAVKVENSLVMLFEGGERAKSVEGLDAVWRFLADIELDRKSLVLSVGGGATSDLVGFAAATYMRGIACIHIPTTLLAHVDASVGGKSGINYNGIKNLIGSIAQPAGVVIDVDTLSTLPKREIRSGFAEIVKHGLIQDASYFEHVTRKECTDWASEDLVQIIHRSCEIKRDVVQADETEQGLRKTLNFGHTIGHAIEGQALTCGISITHGEAVAIGMAGESYLSYRGGRISRSELETVVSGITQAGLPVKLPVALPVTALRSTLAHDKKNVGGAVKWTLLDRIGQAAFDISVSEDLILDSLNEIQPG
jgi:3-dehydroquinate synthase